MRKNNRAMTGRSVVAALLLLVIILVTLVTTSCSGKFDYLKSDLNDYIEFSESYKNFKVEVDVSKPRPVDTDVVILNLLYSDRADEPKYGDGVTITQPITITAGDDVDIWYRGYLLSDDGEKIDVTGMSNFSDSEPATLSIGANQFVPGFEFNMIGKNTGDYSKFNKITSGSLNDSLVAYVSYTRVKGSDTATKTTATYQRLDLSTDLDAKYGVGFKDKVLSLTIGGDKLDFKTDIGDTTYTYTDFKVGFATDCESNPMVIECYFPYDYNESTLRNETAYFEVYVDGVVAYDCPEFTDEYLEKKIEDKEINLTLEELNKYEGEKLTDKYRNFATERMMEIYESTYKSSLEVAIWNKLNTMVKANKYPKKQVEARYEYYVDYLSDLFISSGGKVGSGSTAKTYDTFDAYVNAYLGVGTGYTWQDHVTAKAQEDIKKRMITLYILKAENLLPTDEELEEARDEAYQSVLDQSLSDYFYYSGIDKSELSEEEYAEIVDECRDVVDYNFDEEYFIHMAYENILMDTMIDWPEVSTLDDRRSYPQDK